MFYRALCRVMPFINIIILFALSSAVSEVPCVHLFMCVIVNEGEDRQYRPNEYRPNEYTPKLPKIKNPVSITPIEDIQGIYHIIINIQCYVRDLSVHYNP